jgi:hypothetical protein
MRLLYCPPMPLLWSGRPHDGTPAARIHKIYLRGLWRKPRHVRLGIALSFLAWPFIVVTMAAITSALNGRQACQRCGRHFATLFVEQIWFAMRHGILPPWYFIYELEQAERHPFAPAFINWYEAKGGIFKLLRYYGGSRDDKTLNDKAACTRAARAAGLATTEDFVVLNDGEIKWIAEDVRFPDCDLFVKRQRGQGGDGAERWLLAAPGRWHNGAGRTLEGADLLEDLRQRSERTPLLVQRRLANHADLADLNCGALATVRLLSIWDEQHRPEITNATLKMPARAGAIVDNFFAGGLAAAVDLASGRLGPATNIGLLDTLRWRDSHPVTGARIQGRQLPLWPEVLAFTRQLHETFITFPVIGFDIAITPDGPCLVEANASSALDLSQRTQRAPLGDARFGRLLAQHLECAEAWRRVAMGEPDDGPQPPEQGDTHSDQVLPDSPPGALPSVGKTGGHLRRSGSLLRRLRPTKLGKRILMNGVAVIWGRLPISDQPALRIHHICHRALWQNTRPAARLSRYLGLLAWIPLMICLGAYCTATLGPEIERRTGKGLLRQGMEQMGLAAHYAIPPFYYYELDFWDDRKRSAALSYLYAFELKGEGGYGVLRHRFSSLESSEALSSKAAFALRCEAQGVPVVPVLAVAQDGNLDSVNPNAEPLACASLFVKPLRGSGGLDASTWIYHEGGTWRSNSGQELDHAGLSEYLQLLSLKKPYVVRRLAENHRDLRILSSGALSTVRVITCLDEAGRPEVTNALFKMSINRNAIVDNYHAGGIVAKVDLTSGVLSAATADARVWQNHPLTGAPIAGYRLPLWDDVLAVARQAHGMFLDQIAIGWDIAILDEGPALVEGNKGPGLDSIQKTLGEPLSSSRFGRLLAFHLERALIPDNEGQTASEPELTYET